MQKEALFTTEAERKMTEEMAHSLGQCLEDISRATGAVAHLYKSVELGKDGASAKVKADEFHKNFKSIIDEVGSIQNASQSTQEERKEEEKKEEKSDYTLDFFNQVSKPDQMKIF